GGTGQLAVSSQGDPMNKLSLFISLAALLLNLGCRKADAASEGSEPAASPRAGGAEKPLKIGYVLHVLNDFSESIRRGAEDAGKELNAQVDVQGPAGSSAQDAIAIFEGMVQRRLDALVVVPAPGDVWVSPIRRALKASIPVVTANITSPDSEAPAWFGQDEYQSGVLLAQTLIKRLGARAAEPG